MKGHVLILEDDESLSKSLAREFEDHGYTVDAVQAIAEIGTSKVFNFAVIDLRLSGGGFGLNAIDPIRVASPDCRIVILSGYGSISTAVEAVKRGAIDYLTKPASFKEIEAAMRGQMLAQEPEFRTQSLSEVEHEHIDFVLTKNDGNISRTARELGLHRQSLQRKLKKYT